MRLTTRAITALCALGGVGGLVAAALSGCAIATPASSPPVVIKVGPEQLEYRTFPPGHPPAGRIHLRGETVLGRCETSLGATCALSFEMPRSGFKHVTATITGVRVTTHLVVTIWTEEGSAPDVLEHEEAHRTIAKHYYGLMEPVARQLAIPLLGRKFVVPVSGGATHPPAAMELAQEELLETLARATSARCEVAQAKFDELTFDQPPSAIADSMQRALIDEAAEYALSRTGE